MIMFHSKTERIVVLTSKTNKPVTSLRLLSFFANLLPFLQVEEVLLRLLPKDKNTLADIPK